MSGMIHDGWEEEANNTTVVIIAVVATSMAETAEETDVMRARSCLQHNELRAFSTVEHRVPYRAEHCQQILCEETGMMTYRKDRLSIP